MPNLRKDKSNLNLVYWIVIGIAILLGTIIRLKGLGKWPLALDEYYIIKSSENILKYGLPQFPSGGYYTRGVLLQYMIAALISFGVKAEFAGRIFTVLANLITIPPLYLIAKKVGNQLIATIVIVIFCFSIWEVEFARFARMYTPFQAIFIWYMYFALKDFTNKNFKNYKWLIILSILSFLVYEGSIFLAVFNFVPFVTNRKFEFHKFLWAVVAFFSSAFFNLFDFRTMNSNPIFPPQFSDAINAALFESPIKIPKILLPFADENIFSIILTILLIIVNIFILIKIIKLLQSKNFWSVFSVLFLGLLALSNQFGLFILSFILLVFWNLFNISNSKKIIILLATLFFVDLFYWFGFGLLIENWYSLFNDFSSFTTWGISKRLIVGFLNFPDNYNTFYNYLNTLPSLTVFSTLFAGALIIFVFLSKKDLSDIKFLFGSLIFVILLATIPTLLYDETRYTFFAVPLLLLFVTYSIYCILELVIKNNSNLRAILFVLITLSIFIFSNDFNYYHLANTDNEDVNYRMIYKDNHMKKHLYRRWDIQNPVDYVKKNLHNNDKIMINENSLEYYLPRVDYFNFDYMHEAFVAISTDYGKKERWSNADLIYSKDNLRNLIENRKSTIWYLVFPENYLYDMNFYEKYNPYLVFEGIDGLIKVYKFPKINNNSK
ncbi:MAG: hypothetical protein H6609_16505 [Ignavibacteriales bacterium]|nr:hypothetical protein [Ignavibacteriales bacterium]